METWKRQAGWMSELFSKEIGFGLRAIYFALPKSIGPSSGCWIGPASGYLDSSP